MTCAAEAAHGSRGGQERLGYGRTGLLREEHEKFREACRTGLNHERYYMQGLRDTEGCRWGHGKLRGKGTEFVRPGREPMPGGQEISADLMPLGSVPDGWPLGINMTSLNLKILYLTCFRDIQERHGRIL